MSRIFDLCGDHLALDFANTLGEREAPVPREHLQSYQDLLAFARQTGLLDRMAVTRLRRLADARPDAAAAVVEAARVFREAIYRLFAAVADGLVPEPDDVAVLNGELWRLEVREDLALGWRAGDEGLDGFVGAIVLAALRLATEEAERGRVRVCEAPDCLWLFYDGSKNRSRRWCDMRQCGNRMKARRHYASTRVRARQPRARGKPPG